MSMNGLNEQQIRGAFPDFYANPAIMALSGIRVWTVSDKDKRPLNAQALMYRNQIYGARVANAATELATLDEMARNMPWAANCALFFRTVQTNMILLDIESDCPPEIKHKLLSLARWALYSETSMSGQGYHLLLELPANFHDFPDAAAKVALKHPNKWYEILLDHWVTFTRNPIDPDLIAAAVNDPANAEYTPETLFAELAENARANTSAGVGVNHNVKALLPDDLSPAQARMESHIVALAIEHHHYAYQGKGLSDFGGDRSRWEFGQMASLARHIHEQTQIYMRLHNTRGQVTGDQATRMLYRAAVDVLEHRPKHEEERNRMPYLLYQAAKCIEVVELPGFTDAPGAKTYVNPNPHTATGDGRPPQFGDSEVGDWY